MRFIFFIRNLWKNADGFRTAPASKFDVKAFIRNWIRQAEKKTQKIRQIPFYKIYGGKSKDDRGRILRGIYEYNRSIQDIHGTHRRKAAKQRAWSMKRVFSASALLITLTAFGLFVFIRPERETSAAVNTHTALASVADGRQARSVEPYAAISAALSRQIQSTGSNMIANSGEVKNLEINSDIPLSQMLNLGIRRIVLDAGHGGDDPGTIGRGKTLEKSITLAVAKKLREQLIQLGAADIRMTRTDDVTVSLQERVDYAKGEKADMFVSIHVNSLPVSRANVIETFYFGPSDDRRTLQVADRENMGSEYGLSDFMEIVERLGKTMKLQESKKLADAIHKSLYQNAVQLDLDAVDTGVKRAPFVVLMGLDVPSVLVEIACMSNDKAERDLNSEENQYRIAEALAAGIMSYQKMGVAKNGQR